MNQEKTLYRESQYMRQWWLWAIMLVITVSTVYNILKADTIASPVSWISLGIILLVNAFLWLLNLRTYYSRKSIVIKYWPLANKTFLITDVKSAKLINYGFQGGWGIRLFTRYGTIYNAQGNKGLWITLTSGKQYVIGTQQTEELDKAMRKILPERYVNTLQK